MPQVGRMPASIHGQENAKMRIDSRHLNDVVVLTPRVFEDARGYFMEAYRADTFRELGLPAEFLQENQSYSKKGVVRGLHFQWDPPMGKLMRVTRGTAFLVAVDIRKGSPTLGQNFCLEVSAENHLQVWAPAGFARGFCALSDEVVVQYKCTGIYNPNCESGIRWNDPDLAIPWPMKAPLVSEKDGRARSFADWLASAEADQLAYDTKASRS
jgi:dTDP-4-dehydrorhamnose 3,5-epimerase